MINICNCTGCRACEQICSRKCIEIISNEEGFLVPRINDQKCVQCGKCTTSCPQNYDLKKPEEPKVYAARLKDKKELLKSSSGGVFSALANYILDSKGVIVGCTFDDTMTAVHICINTKVELDKLRGSKYVQSDTGDTYSQTKKFLNEGIPVLYTGTPCQIAGLKAYLDKEYDNLITADLLCHGVPSPRLFSKYISWYEKKLGEKIISYNFRSKVDTGWGLDYKVKTKTKSITQRAVLDTYYNAFLKGKTYRECCYTCKYADVHRVGDITIADYWGIGKYHPEFYSIDGVSLILVNSQKGQEVFEKVKIQFDYIESTISKAMKKNHNLYKPTERPSVRDNIYRELESLSFSDYSDKYLKVGLCLKTRLKKFLPNILQKKYKIIKKN